MDGQGLSRFEGDDCIQMITHIRPNWDVREFHGLDYILSTHKDEELVKKYRGTGCKFIADGL